MKASFPAIALGILVLALAAGSLVALVQVQPHNNAAPGTDDKQLSVILFKDKEGREESKLALTTYDLSVAGFANGSDHWFAFPGHEFRFPKGCTLLPFGNRYRDLIGGLANLPSLPLGKDPTAQASRVLSGHDPAAAGDEELEALKRALATLTVTMSDGMRLRPIKDTVSAGWDSGDARVAAEHLPYIEHWDTICHEILRARKNGKVWDGPFTQLLKDLAGINNLDEALAVVGVIGQRNLQQVLTAHLRSA